MADHHPVTPPRRCRGHDPYRRNRSPSRERRMAGTATRRRLDGRGHRSGQRYAIVPSHRPAISRRLHAGLRAVAGHASAPMPPGSVAGAGEAIGARCAANHAHGPHRTLPDSDIHHAGSEATARTPAAARIGIGRARTARRGNAAGGTGRARTARRGNAAGGTGRARTAPSEVARGADVVEPGQRDVGRGNDVGRGTRLARSPRPGWSTRRIRPVRVRRRRG